MPQSNASFIEPSKHLTHAESLEGSSSPCAADGSAVLDHSQEAQLLLGLRPDTKDELVLQHNCTRPAQEGLQGGEKGGGKNRFTGQALPLPGQGLFTRAGRDRISRNGL